MNLLEWCLSLLFCASLALAADECQLQYDKKNPGLFIENSGSKRKVINDNNGSIKFKSSVTVSGYCVTGFRNLEFNGYQSDYTNVTFSCISKTLYFTTKDGHLVRGPADKSLACSEALSFYQDTIPNCDWNGLVFGFNVSQSVFVLAEVCYNFQSWTTDLIHYTSTIPGSSFPGESTLDGNLTLTNRVHFSNNLIKEEEKALKNAIKANFSSGKTKADYEIDYLIPTDEMFGAFSDYADAFENINSIAIWKTLRKGNWKELTGALKKLFKFGVFDIYAGTSGAVQYPNSNGEVAGTISYQVNNTQKAVPLYIWNYIVDRNDSNAEVVVIGVNSPFAEALGSVNGNYHLCNDICYKYQWSKSITNALKKPDKGYVFCCAPDDVRDILPNLPDLTPSENTTTPSWNVTATPTPSWNYTTPTIPSWNFTTPSTPTWNFTTPSWNFTTPGWNFTTPSWNFTTPSWNFTTPPTPTWNFTTPSWNFTTPGWNFTTPPTPSWNFTTPSWNFTTPGWNFTTPPTPSWNFTTPSWNFTTPGWNFTTPPTPSWNFTTPSWNFTTPGWNFTTPPTPSWNFTTPSWNFTTPGWNFTTPPTPSWNFTTPGLNFTTPSWNFTTPGLNFTTPTWNYTTPSFNMTTTPSWNFTNTTPTPSWNTTRTTPIFNSTTPVWTTQTPMWNTTTVTPPMTTTGWNMTTPVYNATTPTPSWNTTMPGSNYTTATLTPLPHH